MINKNKPHSFWSRGKNKKKGTYYTWLKLKQLMI